MGASLTRRHFPVLAALLAFGAVGLLAGVVADAARDQPVPVRPFAGARVADFATTYGAPGAIGEVADPAGSGERVLKLSVSNRDVYPLTPTENPRAELVSPDMIGPGADFWLATKFLVPGSYPEIDPDGWVTLVSVYGEPFNGSSPWRLELVGDDLQWQRNGTYDFDTPFSQPLARDRWTSVLLHERLGAHGFVEMWIDDRRVEFFPSARRRDRAPTRRLRMATMDRSNDEGLNSARIGQYREAGMFAEGTIYFGALRVGPTRASVSARR